MALNDSAEPSRQFRPNQLLDHFREPHQLVFYRASTIIFRFYLARFPISKPVLTF